MRRVCILIPRRDIICDDLSLLKCTLEQLITECSRSVSLSWQPDVVGTLTSVLKLTRDLRTGVPENDTVRGSPFIIKYLRGGPLSLHKDYIIIKLQSPQG